MFSRKRHFYEKKTFYVAAVSALSLVLSLGFWMGEDSFNQVKPDRDEEQVEQPQNLDSDQPVMSGQVDQNIGQAGITGHGAVEIPERTEYYVVEEDQLIKVYLLKNGGVKQLVRTSEISFDLLSAEDQAMFRLGVHLENEEQLMELLQDFES